MESIYIQVLYRFGGVYTILSPRAQNSVNTDKEVQNRFIPRAKCTTCSCTCAIASYPRVQKEMASSESQDDQIFIEASQQYEDTIHENIEDDTIYLEASHQFEAEFAEQYLKDLRKYEHMDQDDFGIYMTIDCFVVLSLESIQTEPISVDYLDCVYKCVHVVM